MAMWGLTLFSPSSAFYSKWKDTAFAEALRADFVGRSNIFKNTNVEFGKKHINP